MAKYAVPIWALVLSGTCLAAPAAYHEAVNDLGPALWFKFDEPAGSTMAANSGYLGGTFGLSFPNGATLGVPMADGDTGIHFDGTGDYAISGAAAPAQFLGNPSFTAEAIVIVDTNNANFGYPPFLHWGSAQTGRSVYFSLFRFTPNRVFTGFYNAGLRMPEPYPVQEFVHLVWVRDSAGGTADEYTGSTLYINGQPVALEIDTTLPGTNVINVTSSLFYVGQATDGNRFMKASIDEIVLYDRALTPAEVQGLCEALDLPLTGDVNDDRTVDFADLNILLNTFGTADPSGDVDGDGDVDFADLNTMLAAWENTAC